MCHIFFNNFQEQTSEAIVLIHDLKSLLPQDDYVVATFSVLITIYPNRNPEIAEKLISFPISKTQAQDSASLALLLEQNYGLSSFAHLNYYKVLISAHQDPALAHCSFCLRSIIQDPIIDRDLDMLFSKSIQIHIADHLLEDLVLVRDLNAFASVATWSGNLITFYLECDQDNAALCRQALSHAHTLFANQDYLNNMIFNCAYNHYSHLTNESFTPWIQAFAIKANGLFSVQLHHNLMPKIHPIIIECNAIDGSIIGTHISA